MISKRLPFFLALGALIALVVGVQAVAAHSRPIRFTPAPGAVLETAPTSIQSWFTSDIRNVDDSFIRVFDSANKRVDTGSIRLTTDRRQMSINLQSDLPGGSYLVYWSTFDDADDEVFAGCYIFFVGQAAANAAAAAGNPMDGGERCPVNPTETTVSSIEIEIKVDGSNATINMMPTNFEPRSPDGTTHEVAKGHYHIYLDKIPVDLISGEGHSHDGSADSGSTDHAGHSGAAADDPNGLIENPVMWNSNSYTFKDLRPGLHTVAVALNYDDHTSYNPPVIATANFEIGGGSGGGVETWMLIAGIGVAGAVGLAAGQVLTRE